MHLVVLLPIRMVGNTIGGNPERPCLLSKFMCSFVYVRYAWMGTVGAVGRGGGNLGISHPWSDIIIRKLPCFADSPPLPSSSPFFSPCDNNVLLTILYLITADSMSQLVMVMLTPTTPVCNIKTPNHVIKSMWVLFLNEDQVEIRCTLSFVVVEFVVVVVHPHFFYLEGVVYSY